MNFTLPWKRLAAVEAGPDAWLRLAALAAWLAAAVVLVRAGLESRQATGRIEGRVRDLEVLAAQERTVQGWLDSRERFLDSHREAPAAPPGLDAMAASLGGSNEVREIARTPLAEGWEAVRVGVRAAQAPLASLSPLLEAAESADPPWRLAALVVEPLSPRPGLGRVELEFETLAKPAP